MLKKVLLTGVAGAALSVAGTAAHANPVDNITTNTWYTGHFTGTPSPLLKGHPADLGTNGPILPNISKQPTALPAPGTAGGVMAATITLPHGGTLLVTDVEDSGDRFAMFVNSANAAPAPPGATGLIPGGQQAIGSFTSVPAAGHFVGENITAALLDPFFSSGTFVLPPGTDTITGIFAGPNFTGNMDLIVETRVPEPAGLALLGAGLLGLGAVQRRRRTGSAASQR